MPDELSSPYAVKVRRCTIHAGRFRWDIHRNGRSVLPSPESLATRQEAETHGRAEAERVVWTAGENRRRGDGAMRGQRREEVLAGICYFFTQQESLDLSQSRTFAQNRC